MAWPDESHPGVLKVLARAIFKPSAIIFKKLWIMVSSQRPEGRQVSEQLLKVEKESVAICRQGSIALTSGKITGTNY